MQASYGHREAGCVFCAVEGSGRVLLENELALCIADASPVSEGHCLVIARRHVNDELALHQPERNSIVELFEWRGKVLEEAYSTVTDFKVGLNSGTSAGQTVVHSH